MEKETVCVSGLDKRLDGEWSLGSRGQGMARGSLVGEGGEEVELVVMNRSRDERFKFSEFNEGERARKR